MRRRARRGARIWCSVARLRPWGKSRLRKADRARGGAAARGRRAGRGGERPAIRSVRGPFRCTCAQVAAHPPSTKFGPAASRTKKCRRATLWRGAFQLSRTTLRSRSKLKNRPDDAYLALSHSHTQHHPFPNVLPRYTHHSLFPWARYVPSPACSDAIGMPSGPLVPIAPFVVPIAFQP